MLLWSGRATADEEGTLGAALPIGDGLTPEALRRQARHEANRRAALRMLAIANALEGMSRAEAARLAGMERQAARGEGGPGGGRGQGWTPNKPKYSKACSAFKKKKKNHQTRAREL